MLDAKPTSNRVILSLGRTLDRISKYLRSIFLKSEMQMACSSRSFLGSQNAPFEPDNEVSLPPKMAPSNRTTKYLFPEMIASCRNPKYLFPKWLLDALRTGTLSIFLEDSKYLRPKRPLRSGTRSIFGRYSAPRTSLFPMEVCDLSLESLCSRQDATI